MEKVVLKAFKKFAEKRGWQYDINKDISLSFDCFAHLQLPNEQEACSLWHEEKCEDVEVRRARNVKVSLFLLLCILTFYTGSARQQNLLRQDPILLLCQNTDKGIHFCCCLTLLQTWQGPMELFPEDVGSLWLPWWRRYCHIRGKIHFGACCNGSIQVTGPSCSRSGQCGVLCCQENELRIWSYGFCSEWRCRRWSNIISLLSPSPG